MKKEPSPFQSLALMGAFLSQKKPDHSSQVKQPEPQKTLITATLRQGQAVDCSINNHETQRMIPALAEPITTNTTAKEQLMLKLLKPVKE